MKRIQNEGTADRIVRIVAALAIAVAIVAGLVTGPVAIVAGVIGLVLFATGALGFCPLYALFGFNTCPVRRA